LYNNSEVQIVRIHKVRQNIKKELWGIIQVKKAKGKEN